eukprot:gene15088-17862_t
MNYLARRVVSAPTYRIASNSLFRSNGSLSMITKRSFSTEQNGEKKAEETKNGEKKELTHEEVVEDLKKQLAETHKNLLYTAADRENVRKLGKEEVDKAKKFGVQSFAKELIEVVDQLEMALNQFKPDQLSNNKELRDLHEGVTMTENLFLKIMGNNGVTRFDPIGEKFDFNQHHALFEIPDATKEAGTIGQVLKKGYMLNNRLVRPAQVGVIRK